MGYAFLSYSTKNQQAADAMRNLLRKEGIETWMAPGDIPAGSRYAQVINQAIKGCSCFVLILSDDSQNSIWVAKEVERAVNYRKLIIPVQIEDMILNDEFELYLSTDQLVAIQKIDEDSFEVKKLIDSVAASAGRKKTEPASEEMAGKSGADIKIKIVGVGGAGCNTVTRMLQDERSPGVEYISVNSDQQSLSTAVVDQTLLVSDEDDLRSGKMAAMLHGTDLLFITAGMGGNAGTNFSRVIAEMAREMGILTVAIVMTPFTFEGSSRNKRAQEGVARLTPVVDTLVEISNQKLLTTVSKTVTMQEAMRFADETLCQTVRGVTDLLIRPGVISVKFGDIRRVLKDKGYSYFGTGVAEGAGRMIAAAQNAVSNPLLLTDISKAKSALINITGPSSMTVEDIMKASDLITEAVGPDTDTLLGTAVDESMSDSVRIIILATGLGE